MNKFENFEPENNVNLIDEDFQSIKAKSYSRTTKNIIKKGYSATTSYLNKIYLIE